jgi:hypothetical protein
MPTASAAWLLLATAVAAIAFGIGWWLGRRRVAALETEAAVLPRGSPRRRHRG